MTCRSESKPSSLRRFYEDNPDEELTGEDIRVKFNWTADQARHAIEALKRNGLIRRVDGTYRRARGVL